MGAVHVGAYHGKRHLVGRLVLRDVDIGIAQSLVVGVGARDFFLQREDLGVFGAAVARGLVDRAAARPVVGRGVRPRVGTVPVAHAVTLGRTARKRCRTGRKAAAGDAAARAGLHGPARAGPLVQNVWRMPVSNPEEVPPAVGVRPPLTR